jgi:hypothetical protein
MRVRYTSDATAENTGDRISIGTVGVVWKYNKEPVAKIGCEKPVVLEIDWGMPPVSWCHLDLYDILIHEH